MNANRKKAEQLIYKAFDAIDSSKENSSFYKQMFSQMSDEQFLAFCKRRLPFRLQLSAFENELNPKKCIDGLHAINVPVLETVTNPQLYKNKDGKPVETTYKAMVGYINLKKLKQFVTKKSGYNTNIDVRNPKTGQIVGNAKGVESDRELESMTINGLDNSIDEFIRARADSPKAKQSMYNTISTLGYVSKDDIEEDPIDVTSKNLLNVYMLGSHLNTNLINKINNSLIFKDITKKL